MTGDFGAAVPLLLAAAVALAVRRRLSPASIYTEKLSRRGLWVPSGLRPAGVDAIRARDLMISSRVLPDAFGSIDADASLFQVIGALENAPVVRVIESGRDVGVIERAGLDEELHQLGVHGSSRVRS